MKYPTGPTVFFKILPVILPLFFAVVAVQQTVTDSPGFLFQQAEINFNSSNPTEKTDSLAFHYYESFLQAAPQEKSNAQRLYISALNLGILHQTYDRQEEALARYHLARWMRRRFQLPDSLDFQPYLFSGNAHYFINHFDSAIHYFELAEQLVETSSSPLPEEERLYNSLGAVYFEAGNFSQSVNYFQKALEVLLALDPDNSEAYYSFRSNEASARRKLEQYHEAVAIYRELIPMQINTNQLLINLGNVFLDLSQPDSALYYLARLDSSEGIDTAVLSNHLGLAWLLKNNFHLADSFLSKALASHDDRSVLKNNSNLGTTYRLFGMLEEKKRNFPKALQYYQKAVVQFDYDFNDTLTTANPKDFEGGFVSYDLFECLYAKARCWHTWYLQSGNDTHAEAASNTYAAAFALVDYLKASLDNEEARLFTGRSVLPAYQSAVDLLVMRYQNGRHQPSLRLAFEWAEKSKASALSIQLREDEVKGISGIPDSLLILERDLRFLLSKLMLQQSRTTDSASMITIRTALTDCRLQLSRLFSKLNEFPAYYRRKHAEDSLDFGSLLKYLEDNNSRLLTYFHSGKHLYSFVLDGRSIILHTFSFSEEDRKQLIALISSLRAAKAGEIYAGSEPSMKIYKSLVRGPIASGKKTRSLLISAHELLTQLPFEALEDENGNYLIESFDISYQYSAYFLRPGSPPVKRTNQEQLVVAPFSVERRFKNPDLQPLRFSMEEIKGLEGLILIDSAATKMRFMEEAGKHTWIHLATHASSNPVHPLESFITFFPSDTLEPSYKLYTHEIYNLPFQNLELAFLSACETGSGKLEAGEGVLSLSRAFARAGCNNLVISLWKASDQPTAYISRHFYEHLKRGSNYSQALQQARIDLLEDPDMAQFHSPEYWSHLVFIGQPVKPKPPAPFNTCLLIAASVFILILSFWYLKRSRRPRIS